MRILIVSDTHRHNENYMRALERVSPVDMVIHCGDSEGSEYIISEAAGCPVHIVSGNNDFFSNLPRDLEIMVGNYKVWVTHGHNYYVSSENETIKQEAKRRGVDIVVYGHSHRPIIEEEGDIIALNPGSLTYPRQEGKRPSYILMVINKKGRASFEIYYL